MAKFIDVNNNVLNSDVILWTGRTFSSMTVNNLSKNIYNFKELIVILHDSITSIVPIIENETKSYGCFSFMDNSVHATGWIYLEISSSTSFKITNNYISHAFNGSHPNQTALNFTKIIGRY
ncbi:hypothetical protein DW202_03185 [Coprobacillus sp. AM17-34]|jgi:hypothetical protein|uniref:hypothetical protein n=1 Tax=Faecalibacillus intestinalis TaxID=1982626 RepID=UPI000E4E966C|nr:hypothetical protein [Faecalibacillus intestinalis]RGG33016.1 hypothetical protein DWY19_01630 [Coprobacillus sp. AF24-1LB]RHO35776.1 hypothetical protein DW202_03185 [Coprobacillus sp. AM17-34]